DLQAASLAPSQRLERAVAGALALETRHAAGGPDALDLLVGGAHPALQQQRSDPDPCLLAMRLSLVLLGLWQPRDGREPRLVATCSPGCSSIIAPAQIAPAGLAIPLPAMSGAEP